MSSPWAGARVLVTGGMGFIGSTLCRALADAGADVLVVDAMIPEYGGNLFNLDGYPQVRVNFGDVCDPLAMNQLVRNRDFVFHLAGQVSHVKSLTDPFSDIEFNVKGTAVVMEAVRHHAPDAKVVFTGTRGQYGPATKLPVAEDAPTDPKGIYEISNLTAEKIVRVYHEMYSIPAVMLRLTNVYGPRAQMRHSQYGVVNWFVRLALDGVPMKVFGDGTILRDFLFVDDCVQAILRSALAPLADGEVLNVGVDRPNSFLGLAKTLCDLCPGASWEFAPFSPDRKAQEPGDFYSDISKIRRLVGWEPATGLRDGLSATLAFYQRFGGHYWTPEPAGRRAILTPRGTPWPRSGSIA